MSLISILSGEHDVYHAECESHALALLSTGNVFDLALIADDDTGHRIAQILEKQEAVVPIIFITDANQTGKYYGAGAATCARRRASNGFIRKPIGNYHEFLNTIRRFLSSEQVESNLMALA